MVRTGECTVGCGACCQYLRLQVSPIYWDIPDVRHWVELHGIQLEEVHHPSGVTGIFARIPIPCSALTPDKRCGLHGTPERPAMCAGWPFGSGDLSDLKEVCTYSFVSEPSLEGSLYGPKAVESAH